MTAYCVIHSYRTLPNNGLGKIPGDNILKGYRHQLGPHPSKKKKTRNKQSSSCGECFLNLQSCEKERTFNTISSCTYTDSNSLFTIEPVPHPIDFSKREPHYMLQMTTKKK